MKLKDSQCPSFGGSVWQRCMRLAQPSTLLRMGRPRQAASGHMPADGSANELCVAAGVLGAVAGSAHAAHKLLSAHSGRLRSAQQRLLKPQNAGAVFVLTLLISACMLDDWDCT